MKEFDHAEAIPEGSLQRRKRRRLNVWVALWWQNGHRRYKTLGRCSAMSKAQHDLLLDAIMHPLNRTVEDQPARPKYTTRAFVELVHLPFCLRKWKESTAQTSKQRIKHHLVEDLGDLQLETVGRDELPESLGELSGSIMSHLRWDLRAMFQLAMEDGLIKPKSCRIASDAGPRKPEHYAGDGYSSSRFWI